MRTGPRPSKPFGFNLITRIVYVHSALSVAVFGSALAREIAHGTPAQAWNDGVAIVITVAAACAMFGVAQHRSLRVLALLRVILWIAVIKISLSAFPLFGAQAIAGNDSIVHILLNELIVVPIAIYWSRPVHTRYLASLAASASSSPPS